VEKNMRRIGGVQSFHAARHDKSILGGYVMKTLTAQCSKEANTSVFAKSHRAGMPQLHRGGRMTKLKGIAASFAPHGFGCMAIALTSVLMATAFSAKAFAACTVNGNGTITINNANNTAGCDVSAIGSPIGNSAGALGFYVYSQGPGRTLTILNDLTTTVKGAGGISAFNYAASSLSTVNASGRTINLTIATSDANINAPNGDAVAKFGVGVSGGSTVNIGTLNLTMNNLPRGSGFGNFYEHYGVAAGSSVNAGETAVTNGLYSRAVFDNLNVTMTSQAHTLLNIYPLLVGIRAIQGAGASTGNGSSGRVDVNQNLKMDIEAAANDAIGIYVSGGDSQVNLNNSQITINSTSARANAIRLGKTAAVGTGVGSLYSTGNMVLDTLNAPNSGAIDTIWQGAFLDANADTSSTTINAGGAAIRVSGNADQAGGTTRTSFNNLVATTTSTTADLIEVAPDQKDYQFLVRGANSNLTATSTGYIIDVAGAANTPSKVTMDFSQGYMQGLTRNSTASTLDIDLKDGAMWKLAQGGTASTTASFSTLDVTNHSVVDGSANAATAAAFTLQGNVSTTNGGEFRLNDGAANDTLTINGNFTSNTGLLTLDTVLGDDGSATDRLVVNGDTSGSSQVKVFNAGGTGAQTVEGIRVIDVIGASNGTFSLLGDYVHNGDQAVVGGAYAYKLYKNGISDPTDGNWYLRSELKPVDPIDPGNPVDPVPPPEPLYQSGVSVYESYSQLLLGLNGLPSLQQRVGNRYWNDAGNRIVPQGANAIATPYASLEEADVFIEHNGIWGRVEGSHTNIDPRFSTSSAQYDYETFKLQAGLDGLLLENEAGRLIGGITVHYTHGTADIRSPYDTDNGGGKFRTDGYGFGGTLTWYGDNGFYLDAQGQVTWYNSDLNSGGGKRSLVGGNDGFGYALSMETGKKIALDPSWSLTPQAQLVYSSVDFESFDDAFGARVGLDNGDSLQGRLGVALDHENAWYNADGMIDRTNVYAIANLYYEFLEGTKVNVSGTNFTSQNERLWGGLGLGGSYNWNNDKYSIYGEASINTSLASFGDSYNYKGTLGFRVKW
jgi:outer membrane autotransporter protein